MSFPSENEGFKVEHSGLFPLFGGSLALRGSGNATGAHGGPQCREQTATLSSKAFEVPGAHYIILLASHSSAILAAAARLCSVDLQDLKLHSGFYSAGKTRDPLTVTTHQLCTFPAAPPLSAFAEGVAAYVVSEERQQVGAYAHHWLSP